MPNIQTNQANQKIEYRRLTPDEKLYLSRLQGFVFSFSQDEKEIRERIAKGEYNSDNIYGAVCENGQILAGMEVIPFTMWFDGQKTSMFGIGGVASVPENRRQGNIRNIFKKVFEDIYEKNAVFSHLYPFSHDYYRKFGYEQCGGAKRYTIPLAPARKLQNNGTAYDYIKDNDNDGKIRNKLIEIYETYASRHNIMVSRGEDRWNNVFNLPLFGADRLYYWQDADNNIKAWVKFKKDGGTMQINDIAWTDHESMLGILQFMGMFEGSADKMNFTASPEFTAELYWNNLYDIGIETAWRGMNRIVNAKLALELMKKPDCAGKFTIKVTDDFIEQNNNTYSIEYTNGECNVSILTSVTTADIAVSERALMQMILGVYELEQISHRDDVQVNANMQTLKKVFYKKNLHIADYF